MQGKRHQQNLAKRAAMEARDTPVAPAPKTVVQPRKTVKIGKPGYRVSKLYDPDAGQRHMLFQVCLTLWLQRRDMITKHQFALHLIRDSTVTTPMLASGTCSSRCA